jgi:hypothetical protein
MFKQIKEFFTGKPAEAEAPYKVEIAVAPAVATVSEQATQAVVESIAPAKKKPTAKKAPAVKKPRAPKVAK